MKIFYGAAIQGTRDRAERAERAPIHRKLIQVIKEEGHEVVSEHAMGRTKEETAKLMNEFLAPIPKGVDRKAHLRKRLLETIEGDIDAAILELSIPSIGVGIELSHTYLRPRMGINEIPILCLYEKDYWPHDLTSMAPGRDLEEIPNLSLKIYQDLIDAEYYVREFLKNI